MVKEGRQTFGTITCEVSGYLSEPSKQVNEIEVETCDRCGRFLEECTCAQEKTERENLIYDNWQYPDENTHTEEETEFKSLSSKIENYPKEKRWASRIKSFFVSGSLFDWKTFTGDGIRCIWIVGILFGGGLLALDWFSGNNDYYFYYPIIFCWKTY